MRVSRRLQAGALSLRLASTSGRGEREGDEGQARTRGGYLRKTWGIAAKMKSAPGPLEFRSTAPIRRAPRHGRTRREGRTARSCFSSTRLLLHAGCADDASFFSWQVSHRTGQLSRARPHPKRCAFRHQREMSVKGENRDVERYCLLDNDQIGDAHLVDSVAQTSFLKCSDAFPVNL